MEKDVFSYCEKCKSLFEMQICICQDIKAGWVGSPKGWGKIHSSVFAQHSTGLVFHRPTCYTNTRVSDAKDRHMYKYKHEYKYKGPYLPSQLSACQTNTNTLHKSVFCCCWKYKYFSFVTTSEFKIHWHHMNMIFIIITVLIIITTTITLL